MRYHTCYGINEGPRVHDAPLYMALHNGLFANAGLTVNIQTYSSAGKEIAALTNGSADIAVGDYADFFSAQDAADHPGFRIVADAYDAAPSVMQVLSLPGSGVTTPLQLQDKTIGTPEPRSGQPGAVRQPTPFCSKAASVSSSAIVGSDFCSRTSISFSASPISSPNS